MIDKEGIIIKKNNAQAAFIYTPIQYKTECVQTLSATTQMNSSPDISVSVVFMGLDEKRPDMAEPTAGMNKHIVISHLKKKQKGCLSGDFLVGILVTGVGEILVSGIELKINGRFFEDSASPSNSMTSKDLAFLRDKIVTFDNLSSSDIWFEDAQIIGLGENSHGAKNLFEMKTEIIKHLIEKAKVTQVSLEMPAITALAVNDYIQGNSDDKQKTLLALNYPSWQTQSMLKLLDWLKAYNLSNANEIVFSGFDVQQPQLTLSVLKSRFLKDQDMRGLEYLEKLAAIMSDSNPNVEAFTQGIEQLKQHLIEHKHELSRFADVLKQGAIVQNPGLGSGDRSKFMAEQVMMLAQERKTVIWADNTHISKKPSAMGAWIDSSLGDQYIALGLSFDTGTYSAYGPENPYPVHPSFSGSHEDILKSAASEPFLIRLSDLPDHHPLLEQREFRFIGSQPQTYSQFYPHVLKEHFNIIGFTHNTSHTEFLIEHDFQ
ncbi:erythromycin esterase family protein [Marinicella sp. W31]|uniref:erythromycin esterase family protein n=1 Tax=Marinicella sp. W31 TaxID=3023713 RepID=UPI003757BF5A